MLKKPNYTIGLLAFIMGSRLLSMNGFPLTDTTEARYAEIAWLMMETGDWITPWFEPGVPFWGKPPLSFWMQALAAKAFGLSELTLRLPAWFATWGMIGLVWLIAKTCFGRAAAQWSSLIFASMLLTYVSAGAVMTDTFLAFGTTLSLVSFYLVVIDQVNPWRWLFFIGIAIGLLAKGPLALVLIGLPIALWWGVAKPQLLGRLFPWWRGLLLTLLLTIPWYTLAELKTPGFLNYFLVGEHFLRFLDPGWAGDLYGSAHRQPFGMIWIYWLQASFPWGLWLLLGVLFFWRKKMTPRMIFKRFQMYLKSQLNSPFIFLGLAMFSPLIFFTLASNILWTYLLPSLPFTAVFLGCFASKEKHVILKKMQGVFVILNAMVLSVVVLFVIGGKIAVKTEKELVNTYFQLYQLGDSPLIYVDSLPFSARFYSQGRAIKKNKKDLVDIYSSRVFDNIYFAVRKSDLNDFLIKNEFDFYFLMESKSYVFYKAGVL